MSPASPSARLPWALAWRMALGQLVAWGVLYYAFTVVVGPMEARTGWSRTFLNAGLSVSLLVWGVAALPVGVWIQRRGGRELMAAAAGVGGLALVLMGAVPHPVAYIVAWIALGGAMAGMLYEPAFAVITTVFGSEYRRGITLITLVGGLASTVFIPVAQVAVDHLGWRGALVVLGLFKVGVGVPLHLAGLPRTRPAPRSARRGVRGWDRLRGWWSTLRRDLGDPRFVGLALWFSAHAAAFTGLIFQFVPVLQALAVDNGSILQAIAVIGPLQVLGRLGLTARGGRFSTVVVGRWAVAALGAAMLVLLLAPPRLAWLALAAALLGAGNGVTTILRGTAVAELFGRDRYAELNGALSAPGVLAKAAAPLALAGLWSATGQPRAVFAAVLGLVLAGVVGLAIATHAQRSETEPRTAASGGAGAPAS